MSERSPKSMQSEIATHSGTQMDSHLFLGARELTHQTGLIWEQPTHSLKPPFAIIWERYLTPREREIVGLRGMGKSTMELAAELFITKNTLRTHEESLQGKLGLNKQQTVIRAIREGLIPINETGGHFDLNRHSLLTDRENEVFNTLGRGLNAIEGMAVNTFRTHTTNIYSKLDIHNNIEAAIFLHKLLAQKQRQDRGVVREQVLVELPIAS